MAAQSASLRPNLRSSRVGKRAALLAAVTLLFLSMVLTACGTAAGPGGTSGTVGGGAGTGDGGGTGSTTTTGSEGSLLHPAGASQVVLQIRTGGGFVPIEWDYTNVPVFSLYGDGRVIVTGPVIAIYPGPALPNLQTTVVPEEAIQAILSAAGEAGLFDPTFDYGQPAIADAPTTTIIVNANGTTYRSTVYALGMESGASGLTLPQQQARARLADLQNKLTDLSAFVSSQMSWTSYQYSALAVYSQAASPEASTSSTDILPGRLDWPLGDLSKLGEEVAGGFRHLVISGQDLVTLEQKPPLAKATAITLWRSDGKDYHLLFRPLLPDEAV